MENRLVSKRFEITTTPSGKIFAEIGDCIVLDNMGCEHYKILKVGSTKIFNRWMRKS